jgi:hypothetical protein
MTNILKTEIRIKRIAIANKNTLKKNSIACLFGSIKYVLT